MAPAPYPIGTVVQLIYFEAMVKRSVDVFPESDGWEFFSLTVNNGEVSIAERGSTQVENFLGGNCFGCHSKAEAQYDFICETTHGCDPLGASAIEIELLQQIDPRCDN